VHNAREKKKRAVNCLNKLFKGLAQSKQKSGEVVELSFRLLVTCGERCMCSLCIVVVAQNLPLYANVAMSDLPGWWGGGWMVWEEGDID